MVKFTIELVGVGSSSDSSLLFCGYPAASIPEKYLLPQTLEDKSIYEAFKHIYKNLSGVDFINPLEKEKQNDC